MGLNKHDVNVDKGSVSELVKKLRAEGKPRCTIPTVTDSDGNTILDSPDSVLKFECHYATVAYDNKSIAPKDADCYGQAVVVDTDAHFSMTVEQLLNMVTATAWTRVPKEELTTLAEEASSGLVDMTKWVCPVRTPGKPRKIRLLSDAAFVTVLVKQLHAVGKKYVGKTDQPLDTSYTLGLDASLARKAFTAKGAPYAAAYAAAVAEYLPTVEETGADDII